MNLSVQPTTPVDASLDLTQDEETTRPKIFGLRRRGGVQVKPGVVLLGLMGMIPPVILLALSFLLLPLSAIWLGVGGYTLWRKTLQVTHAIWISNNTVFSVTNFRTHAAKVNQIEDITLANFGRTVRISFTDNPDIELLACEQPWNQFATTLSHLYPHLPTVALSSQKIPAQDCYEYYEQA